MTSTSGGPSYCPVLCVWRFTLYISTTSFREPSRRDRVTREDRTKASAGRLDRPGAGRAKCAEQ
ncbi:hypothetical protein [Candidatus Chloroploca sp. Khr17]|uniref:hypothetical protein n=1 Tax=Candidatus Chloroploca sp. Khr17 TaxID=2496869 RepID=UPI001F0EC31B|nr:hypothetical protein [Candidatus Chloroploca sp. Khr17]